MDYSKSLQDQFAPNLICFGCGPANTKGLQIKSFVVPADWNESKPEEPLIERTKVVLRFLPQHHHCAFEGMINGGILGSLFDCHLAWTTAHHLMVRHGLTTPPCCVTAKYGVSFEQPTPADQLLIVEAWVTEASDRKAVVEGTLGYVPLPENFDPQHFSREAVEQAKVATITARGRGTFVSVKEGHPAFHRW